MTTTSKTGKRPTKAVRKSTAARKAAPKKIETRHDRRKAEVKAEKELTRHLKKVNDEQKRTLRARRAVKSPAAKAPTPRTEAQQDEIVRLGTLLGLAFDVIRKRIKRADTFDKADRQITRMKNELNAQEPAQALYEGVDELAPAFGNLEAEYRADLIASRLTGSDYRKIAWLIAGLGSAVFMFCAGWVAGWIARG